MPPETTPDLLYPLPANLPALEAVRGSILILDRRWLRGQTLIAAYEQVLTDRALLDVTAAEWILFPAALAHWQALDALDLPAATVASIGGFVGEQLHGAFLNTLLRLAGQLGLTPWSVLRQFYKLWVRSWRGGGITVRRVSATSARVDILRSAVASSRFFRASLRGAIDTGIAPLCERPLVVEMDELRTPTSFVLRVSWV